MKVIIEKCWPDNKDYFSKCSLCSEHFLGPKRAPCCWVCEQSKVEPTEDEELDSINEMPREQLIEELRYAWQKIREMERFV